MNNGNGLSDGRNYYIRTAIFGVILIASAELLDNNLEATEQQTLLIHQWQLSNGNTPDSLSAQSIDYLEALEAKYAQPKPEHP